MKIAIFADGSVGNIVADIFNKNQKKVEYLILNHKNNNNYKKEIKRKISFHYSFDYDEFLEYCVDKKNQVLFDLGLLCWWPFISKEDVISKSKLGFLNFHPSLLPYGRGKHPNFWTLVDNTPFGVTLHWVNNAIDGGDIAYQKEILKTWEDNGETLYNKASQEIINLFESNFSSILKGNIPKNKQDLELPIRYSKELEAASKIYLDKKYTARNLINLLRARTFTGYPSCWFEENGKNYEIKITIREKK